MNESDNFYKQVVHGMVIGTKRSNRHNGLTEGRTDGQNVEKVASSPKVIRDMRRYIIF